MIKAHAFILIRNSYTYLPIHLYVPDLIVEVSLQVPPPLFVEELTKDHYHEKPFGHGDDISNAAARRECNNNLLWFHDIEKFSTSVVLPWQHICKLQPRQMRSCSSPRAGVRFVTRPTRISI
ncbi:hypothetical protein JHK86_009809 [Glycine max]|nr:hypothetical protein JHK86_009809 [Glycine max]